MSQIFSCRLCLKCSTEYQNVFGENGDYNMELYTITAKYFDVKFLTDTIGNQPSVVCSKCWNIMYGFNNFQLLVNMAHEQLSKTNEKVLNAGELSDEIASTGITIKSEPITDDNASHTEEISNDISSTGVTIKSEPIMDDYYHQMDYINTNCEENYITIKPEIVMEYDRSMAVEEQTANEENVAIPKFRIVHQTPVNEITPEVRPEYLIPELIMDQGSSFASSTIQAEPQDNDGASCSTGGMFVKSEPISEYDNLNYPVIKNEEESPRKRKIATGINNSSSINFPSHVAATFVGTSALPQKNLHLHGRFTKPEKMDEYVSKWKPILNCGMCDKPLPRLSLLQSHFREEHPDERCYIRCCNHNQTGGTEIYQHAVYHQDPKVFRCDICGKSCISQRTLNDHISYQHSEVKRQNKCSICSRTFKTPTELKEHVDAHKKTENFSSRKIQQKEAFLLQFSKIGRRKK